MQLSVGVIEPSMEDLEIINQLYSLYLSCESSSPLQIIGRINQVGNVDLLCLRQITDLPATEVITQMPLLVEKYLIFRALPCYLERNYQFDQAELLKQQLTGAEKLQFDKFLEKAKRVIEALRCQEVIDGFRTQFRKNLTVFPEYLSCVQAALSELRCFEISTITIDLKN